MRRLPVFIFIVATLFSVVGCEEESPTDGDGNGIDLMKTGVSGTTYLNVEHGFRLSNLPSSGWVIRTKKGKDIETNTEDVLLMAFTTEDKFTLDTSELMDEQIPFAEVSVYGPDPSLPTKPDLAREVMNYRIAIWELLGGEVISKKPVAAVNTTGYEATLSLVLQEFTLIIKQAYFAKRDKGYTIAFIAPEDKFVGLIAYIDPIITSFELF